MEIETSDQAQEQSIEGRIGSKFGFPGQTEAPETQEEVESVETPDFAEIDWDGQKVKVPNALKDAFMRNEDYTRKTQDLAEHRKSLDQMRELAQTKQLEAAFSESIAVEQQEISVIDAYLQQATKLDWSQMTTEQMLRHKVEVDSIKERRAQLADSINGKRSKFTQEMQAKISELKGKSRELASKSIQGFSEETEKAMRSYAVSEGLTDPEIDNVLLDPRSYKVIWKAMQFDKVKAGTTKAADAASKVDKVLRPGAAGEKMPQEKVAQLNFNKAMKQAKSSGDKARVIEERLIGVFSQGK